MFMNNKNKNTSEESQNYKSNFYLDVQSVYSQKVKLLVDGYINKIDEDIIEAAQQGKNSIKRVFDSEYGDAVDRINDYYLSQGFETITYLQSGEYRLTIKWEDIDSYE